MSNPFVKAPLPPKELDAKNQVPDFEKHQKTTKLACTQVSSLNRSDNRHERRLAAYLAKCRKKRRCGSMACPVCFRRMRRVTIGQIVSLMESLDANIYRACLVSKKWQVPIGKLNAGTLMKAAASLLRAISRGPLKDAVIFGAWDFTVNLDPRYGEEPYWQPHLYFVIATNVPELVLHKALLSLVERAPDIPIPKQTGKPDNLWLTVNYSLKTKFGRRGPNIKKGKPNTGYDRLRSIERRELAVVLHKLGVTGRLFMRGIKRSHWTFNLTGSVVSKNE